MRPKQQVASRVQKTEMMKHKVLVYHGQGCAGKEKGDHIMIMPAYNITPQLIREIANGSANAVEDVFKEMPSRMRDDGKSSESRGPDK